MLLREILWSISLQPVEREIFYYYIYIIFNDSLKVNFDYYWLANPPCAHSFVANRNKLNPANRESVLCAAWCLLANIAQHYYYINL